MTKQRSKVEATKVRWSSFHVTSVDMWWYCAPNDIISSLFNIQMILIQLGILGTTVINCIRVPLVKTISCVLIVSQELCIWMRWGTNGGKNELTMKDSVAGQELKSVWGSCTENAVIKCFIRRLTNVVLPTSVATECVTRRRKWSVIIGCVLNAI